jgi:hypothetical protein
MATKIYIQEEPVLSYFFLFCHFQVKVFMVSGTNFILCVIFILCNVPRMFFAKGRYSYVTSFILYAVCCVFVHRYKHFRNWSGPSLISSILQFFKLLLIALFPTVTAAPNDSLLFYQYSFIKSCLERVGSSL